MRVLLQLAMAAPRRPLYRVKSEFGGLGIDIAPLFAFNNPIRIFVWTHPCLRSVVYSVNLVTNAPNFLRYIQIWKVEPDLA